MTANSNQETSAVHPGGSTTYSVQEIAVILGISKKLAYKLCEENALSQNESAESYG